MEKIFIAPGNAGTAQVGENVNIPITDIGGLVQFAINNQIDFTVVGSDDALALGVVDVFQSKNLKIWGPTKAAAKIEWSKSFAKELMNTANIPTAHYKTFTNYNEALAYVKPQYLPLVIKASGLALGKGVTICKTMEEAENTLRDLMVEKIHGEAGAEVIIEEFLQGNEFSTHAFSDGNTFKLLPTSQDHKTINDGDKGPNTGGMGTIAPLPWVTKEIMDEVSSKIVWPALDNLKSSGCPFIGLLYPGLMLTKDGPKVIEFNARFGDPETQSYMRLLKTDLFDILEACVDGNLNDVNIEWENKFACCIVLASGGYPGKYEKGLPISGIEAAEKMPDIVVFHSGTKRHDNQLLTNGGRVLGVSAIGDTLKEALEKAYAAIKLINFQGMQYRTDIGAKSL
jgi:phosphoribosylamine--glycine ligase